MTSRFTGVGKATITLSTDEFLSGRLKTKVLEVAGPGRFCMGLPRPQDFDPGTFGGSHSRDVGYHVGRLHGGGQLPFRDMLITPEAIIANPDVEVDLSEGIFPRGLASRYPDASIAVSARTAYSRVTFST